MRDSNWKTTRSSEFAVEVITISYSMEAIREKEIYAQITNTEVIYIYYGENKDA